MMAESSASSENSAELLQGLEQELAAAHSQLEDYQRLIDEVPSLYETKFRHRLQDLTQDIHRLVEERHGLQELMRRSIPGQVMGAAPATSAIALPRRWGQAAVARARRRLRRLPRWQLALAAGVGALALALPVGLVGFANRWRPASGPAPVSGQQAHAEPPQLRLRAKGEVWFELRSLSNQPVLEATLRPGQATAIPLGDGLRLRSGRPHLLEVAIGDQPFAPLAPARDSAWRTFLAPNSGQTPGLKPKVKVKSS